ncbi:MAG: MarR family transcriptional regulator [Coriobacteriales bacterium]|nr:MarR family transcriptional regulator [Coriobacteriales bacterium]
MTQTKPRIGRLFKQINETIERRANNDMRPQGVTMSQTHVLMELNACAPQPLGFKQLEASMGVAQSTIWGLISRLEAKGLVEVLISSSDARVKLARITAAGEQVCQSCIENINKCEQQLISNLSEEEVTQLAALLERVYQSIAE